jgi:uncharacterized LabA/DUF88 family protein
MLAEVSHIRALTARPAVARVGGLMFKPKTERLAMLAAKYPRQIDELERLFVSPTNVYIDYANVLGWMRRLGWHLDMRRLKHLLDSFDTIRTIKLYYGTLAGDEKSEQLMRELSSYGYEIHTKPVKILRIPINAFSVELNSLEILRDFIRKPLLNMLRVEAVISLNQELRELNRRDVFAVQDRKCNFDVEIGRDLLTDSRDNPGVRHVVLWSGDSDFADALKQMIDAGMWVSLFATKSRVSTELNALGHHGLYIFDIKQIREFICRTKEMKCRD